MFRVVFSASFFLFTCLTLTASDWQTLFDEDTGLKHWKVAENPDSVRIEDKLMVLGGKRAHAFFMGEDGKASWKNFEAEVQFRTHESANAGLFFHTRWQDAGWPGYGLECQINATHKDPRKTGSIYAIQDVKEPGHKDGEWVTMVLRVEGPTATVTVNGKETNRWTQTENHTLAKKRINAGTFAFQAHDPGSKVEVKSFKVRKLP